MNKLFKIITLISLILLSSISYAQGIIDIRDFKGLATNFDLEDIDNEYFSILKNFYPYNGKLIKTFGYGSKVNTATPYVLDNFQTFINDNLNNDYLYIGSHITSSNSLIPYAWYNNTWVDLKRSFSSLTNFVSLSADSFYHADSYNPIIQADGILRILPGNVGQVNGNESKGLWLGYIARELFDNHFKPDSGFYGYLTNIDKPNFNASITKLDSALCHGNKYYRFSYIYDGIQEGLLSNIFAVNYDSFNIGKFEFSFDTTDFNKRITGLNVYYSNDINGTYNLIHIIDFLRDSTDVLIDDSCRNGLYYAYIPDLITYNFEAGKDYALFKPYTYQYRIKHPGIGSGYSVFACSIKAGTATEFFDTDVFNGEWRLMEWNPSNVVKKVGSNRAFWGTKTFIIDSNATSHSLAGGIINISAYDSSTGLNSYDRYIDMNIERALHYQSDTTNIGDTIKTCKILSPINGLYRTEWSGDSIKINFFDTGLTPTEEHPLQGETSIKVNGKYAKIIGNRLWQGNIVLDPGGKSEIHDNWVSYSEIGQYDVNPVSNIISFAYKGSGAITGVYEAFGNPIITKENIIIFIDTKGSINPTDWQEIQSIYNLGNIADKGAINVLGDFYTVYYDGIYQLKPSHLAAVSSVPLERLRISEPVGDIFNALTLAQKRAIKSQYDQNKSEIHWLLGDSIYAYNVNKGYWRQISTTHTPYLYTLDENANILVYNNSDKKIYSTNEKESVACELKTKTFPIWVDYREEPVSSMYVTYNSDALLRWSFYRDNSITNALFDTLKASSTTITSYVNLKKSGKNFNINIKEPAVSLTDVEIHRIKLYIYKDPKE